MIRRILGVLLLFGLSVPIPAFAVQKPAAQAPKAGAEEKKTEELFSRFRWVADSSELRGLVHENRKLESLKIESRDPSLAEVETEVTRPDARSMRTTRRVFSRGPNGERQLVEVITEELRATAGDGVSGTKTVSTRDINGGMRVARKEVQETTPAGAGSFRTQATVMLPGGSNALEPAAEVRQVEKTSAQGVIEIERTNLSPSASGGWTTAERRVSTTREANNEVSAQEEIYRQDANGRLSLSRREISREWKDAAGKAYQDKETYLADVAGKLQLDARTSIVSVTYADGSRQSTQTLMRRNPIASGEGLKLAEQIVETVRPTDARTVEKEISVQTPDVSGKLQTADYRKVVEKK